MDDRPMSAHLDDARVVMLRDGNPAAEWDVAHAEDCAVCTAELDDARARAALVSEALDALDAPVDGLSAKAAVRGRLDRTRAPLARPVRRMPIGRAAAALLVTAGAAAALPWSPISPWRTETPTPASPPPAATQSSAVDADASAASVAVDVDGPISIVVRSASAGSEVEVVWRDDAEARIAAPRGSSFSLGTGRVEVDASDGTIRIEAPRDAAVALTVNGRTYLERSAAGLTLTEPAAEVSDEGIRFRVREP